MNVGIGVGKIQGMSGRALDEISSNLHFFLVVYIPFKKYLGSDTRIFGIFSSGSPEHATVGAGGGGTDEGGFRVPSEGVLCRESGIC